MAVAGNTVIAGLVIDLGNSETRVMLFINKRAYRYNLSNRFAVLADSYTVPAAYQTTEKTAVFEYGEDRVAYGSLVERELKLQAERPTAIKGKTEQIVTSFTLHRVFISALRLVSEMLTKQLVEVDVTFNVTVLLPPEEQEMKAEEMERMIRAVTEVSSLYPVSFRKKFNIGKVSVHPEGIAALFGAMYKETGAVDFSDKNAGKRLENGDVLYRDNGDQIALDIAPGKERFQDGYLLVIDIGAGTTDFCLVLDMDLVEGSRATHNVAGNNVTNDVKARIKMQYKLEPRDMEEVMRTAQAVEGDNYVHDIEDIVTDAKSKVAARLKQHLVEYLEVKGVSPRSIRGMLVAGGGGEASVRDGVQVSPPMSKLLTDYIQELAPNIATVESEDIPLRELNIEGAALMHKY